MKIITQEINKRWASYHGDNCEVIKGIPDNSIHYQCFSPPFSSLFTYSDSDRDMGNSKNMKEFIKHFEYLIPELYRIHMSGRLVSIHCMNLPATLGHDGFIGIKDFRGDIIRLFQQAGFYFHSEVMIWKDPLLQAVRTKALSLAHKQIVKDSAMCGAGLPDYIVTVRKPGINDEPIKHLNGFEYYTGDQPEPKRKKRKDPKVNKYSHEIWQRYASPVWWDINQSNTLNIQRARDGRDEKHICLAKDSLVLTKQGFVKIQDLKIGDYTLTHKGNWNPIIAKKCTGINPVIKIHAQGVPNLIITPDHKIWTRLVTTQKPKKSMKSHTPEWIEAQYINGNYINLKLPSIIDSPFTNLEWWILGRFLADGHVGGHVQRGMKSFYISVGSHKIHEFLSIVGDHAGTSHTPIPTCTQYRLKNMSYNFRELLWKCGHKADNKQIPLEGLCLNKDKSEALLSGYLSGDGHKDKMGRWHCCSVSRALLLGMSMVAQRARSIIPSVYMSKKPSVSTIQGRKIHGKQLWVMMFNDNPEYTFSEILKDGAWKKTRKIECKDKMETWSIQVANDSSFTAEGCIVKNCPLQLDTIARCLELWSNKGDTVLDPFAGIASTGYQSLLMNRNFIGVELKESYYKQGLKNLKHAANTKLKSFFADK